MTRRLPFLALLIALAVPAAAQPRNVFAPIAVGYDLDSTASIYCRLTGTSGPFSSAKSSSIAIETSGSSTTLTKSVASSGPFAVVEVGDVILVRDSSNALQILTVDAKAGADEITVDTAVDLGTVGVDWQYRTLSCGTGANDGWINTARFEQTLVCVEPKAGTSTGAFHWHLEVKTAADGAGPVQAYPDNSTTKPATVEPGGVGYDYGQCVNVTTPHDWLRVGLGFATGGDDGTDTGAAKERITVTITGRQ